MYRYPTLAQPQSFLHAVSGFKLTSAKQSTTTGMQNRDAKLVLAALSANNARKKTDFDHTQHAVVTS